MPGFGEILTTALSDAWPAVAVAATAALIAATQSKAGRPRAARALLALGLAGGFAAGLSRIVVWPSLPLAPSDDGWKWIAWIAPAAGLATAVAGLSRAPRPVWYALAFGVAAGAAWLLVDPFVDAAGNVRGEARVVLVGSVALVAGALATASSRALPTARGVDFADIAWLVTISGVAMLLALFAHSAVLGRTVGVLAASFGTLVGMRFALGGEAPTRATAVPLATILTGLGLASYLALNYEGQVTLPATALLAAFGGLLGGLAAIAAGPRSLLARGLGLALVAAGVAAAILIADARPSGRETTPFEKERERQLEDMYNAVGSPR